MPTDTTTGNNTASIVIRTRELIEAAARLQAARESNNNILDPAQRELIDERVARDSAIALTAIAGLKATVRMVDEEQLAIQQGLQDLSAGRRVSAAVGALITRALGVTPTVANVLRAHEIPREQNAERPTEEYFDPDNDQPEGDRRQETQTDLPPEGGQRQAQPANYPQRFGFNQERRPAPQIDRTPQQPPERRATEDANGTENGRPRVGVRFVVTD